MNGTCKDQREWNNSQGKQQEGGLSAIQLEEDICMPPIAQANHSYVAGILSGDKKVNL